MISTRRRHIITVLRYTAPGAAAQLPNDTGPNYVLTGSGPNPVPVSGQSVQRHRPVIGVDRLDPWPSDTDRTHRIIEAPIAGRRKHVTGHGRQDEQEAAHQDGHDCHAHGRVKRRPIPIALNGRDDVVGDQGGETFKIGARHYQSGAYKKRIPSR